MDKQELHFVLISVYGLQTCVKFGPYKEETTGLRGLIDTQTRFREHRRFNLYRVIATNVKLILPMQGQ